MKARLVTGLKKPTLSAPSNQLQLSTMYSAITIPPLRGARKLLKS